MPTHQQQSTNNAQGTATAWPLHNLPIHRSDGQTNPPIYLFYFIFGVVLMYFVAGNPWKYLKGDHVIKTFSDYFCGNRKSGRKDSRVTLKSKCFCFVWTINFNFFTPPLANKSILRRFGIEISCIWFINK